MRCRIMKAGRSRVVTLNPEIGVALQQKKRWRISELGLVTHFELLLVRPRSNEHSSKGGLDAYSEMPVFVAEAVVALCQSF